MQLQSDLEKPLESEDLGGRPHSMLMHRNRRSITILVIVIVGSILAILYARRGKIPSDQRYDVAPANSQVTQGIEVLTASSSFVPQWLDVTGTVRAELEATLGTKVSGRVVQVLVHEGDRVRRGQTLIQLDARDLDAAIHQADANIRAGEVGRESAKLAAVMEDAASNSRIASAEALVSQADAAMKSAIARNQQVEAGPRKQERASASLAVAQAKSNLNLAESNLKRMTGLLSEGAISRQSFEIVQAQYEVARAQFESSQQAQSMTDEGSRSEEIRSARESVRQSQFALEQARAGLKQAQAAAMQTAVRRQDILAADAQIGQSKAARQIASITRDYATIVAPFDGVVTQKLTDPGSMAGPGTPLLKIQGGATRLEVVVPDGALVNVRQGAEMSVRLDALGRKVISGSVTEIAPQGDVSSHTFLVKVSLSDTGGVRSGMFGRTRIQIGTEKRLVVPVSATLVREGLHYLFVVDGTGIAHLRLVTVGDPDSGRIPILSGLKDGEQVVCVGAERVTDGSKVR